MSETKEPMEFKIVVRVISQQGFCGAGHVVGDEVVFEGAEMHGKLCTAAMHSIYPKVFAMMYGATFPWLDDQDVMTHACPDAYNPVVFEVRRVREE